MSDESVTIESSDGRLRGRRHGATLSFKGVAYAAPCAGANRFAAPQPVSPWTGVRDAFSFGPRSPQERETFGDAPILRWYAQSEPYGEDCCVLNVYTPAADGAKRPVMVYFHGGGYVTGGGGGAALDGSNLAHQGDVVVVTVNHRLNVFGYLNLGHLDADEFGDAANAGHLDLIASLKWVRRNIERFGGDPGQVTLFGQSGGGSKILVLMGMPEAKGLFHRVINMSGTSGTTVAPATATESYVKTILDQLGITKQSLRRLREVPAEKLITARLAAVRKHGEGSRPVIDGRHVFGGAMTPEGLALHAAVPALMGTVRTEATFYFASDDRHLRLTDTQVRARIEAQFAVKASEAGAIMDAFRQEDPARSPSDILMTLITDSSFRVPIIRAAEAKAAAGAAPVYLYNFVWPAPVEGGRWGVPHTIDIPMAFGNTDRTTELTGTGPQAAEVSRRMMSAFVAFARSGSPVNPLMPDWKPLSPPRRWTMTIGSRCELVDGYLPRDLAAGERLHLDPFNRKALLTYVEPPKDSSA